MRSVAHASWMQSTAVERYPRKMPKRERLLVSVRDLDERMATTENTFEYSRHLLQRSQASMLAWPVSSDRSKRAPNHRAQSLPRAVDGRTSSSYRLSPPRARRSRRNWVVPRRRWGKTISAASTGRWSSSTSRTSFCSRPPGLPDEIAYALAWSLIERFSTLEAQYRHMPPERSSVSYPIDPKAACRTSIPLHPGAERYFREAGHLQKPVSSNVRPLGRHAAFLPRE
jgi:hypothetical protein